MAVQPIGRRRISMPYVRALAEITTMTVHIAFVVWFSYLITGEADWVSWMMLVGSYLLVGIVYLYIAQQWLCRWREDDWGWGMTIGFSWAWMVFAWINANEGYSFQRRPKN